MENNCGIFLFLVDLLTEPDLLLESILPNFDFFVFLIFAYKLGHLNAKTKISYVTNTQA
jgi:hypothetical protein